MNGKRLFTLILKNRILHHILFWLLAFYWLLQIFTKTSNSITSIDYIYTAIFLLLLVIAVYINLYVFIPNFLSKKRYVLYIALTTIDIGLFSTINIKLFSTWIDFILPNYYFISYYNYLDIVKFFVVFIAVTSLVKLSKGWFQLTETKQNLLKLQSEKKEAELNALKSQINPHFLFNSLNSIYSLSLSKSEKTPEIILKIADILRYIIYESSDSLVSLTKEIELMQNYIDLQKLRSDDKVSINVEIGDNLKNKRIAPLLLFPLVENSFKHGVKGRIENSYVDIKLYTQGNQIIFIIENNKGEIDNVEKNKFHGIGLDNIRKRLNTIYPNSYTMKIINSENIYRVELSVPNS
ncbi:MAG: sensor histidine kinase [Bacteroidales bacterium]